MVFDLRAVAIAASLILASIAVAAAAEGAQDQPARPATSAAVAVAHPIRVILPAPWEPAPASSGTQALVQK